MTVTVSEVRKAINRVISGQMEEEDLLVFFSRMIPDHPVEIAESFGENEYDFKVLDTKGNVELIDKQRAEDILYIYKTRIEKLEAGLLELMNACDETIDLELAIKMTNLYNEGRL